MFIGRLYPTAVVYALMASGDASGQMTISRPAFEVASIRPAGPIERLIEGLSPEDFTQTMNHGSGVRVDGQRVTLAKRSLRSLIATAYRVRLDQVSGPAWLG